MHSSCGIELRPEGVRWRKGEGGKDDTKQPNAEIANPPPQRRKLPLASGKAKFPSCDDEQATNDHDEGQGHLLAGLDRVASESTRDRPSPSPSEVRTRTRRYSGKRRREERLASGRDCVVCPDGRKEGLSVAVPRKAGA